MGAESKGIKREPPLVHRQGHSEDVASTGTGKRVTGCCLGPDIWKQVFTVTATLPAPHSQMPRGERTNLVEAAWLSQPWTSNRDTRDLSPPISCLAPCSQSRPILPEQAFLFPEKMLEDSEMFPDIQALGASGGLSALPLYPPFWTH